MDKLQVRRTLQRQNYWSNTSSNEVLKRLLENATSELRDENEHLIAGESVWKQVSEELTYRELYDTVDRSGDQMRSGLSCEELQGCVFGQSSTPSG